jgi:hypothetical protein
MSTVLAGHGLAGGTTATGVFGGYQLDQVAGATVGAPVPADPAQTAD